MGLMRFHIQPPERITDEMIQQAYLSGIDRVAWPVRTTFENGMLSMHRSVCESANLHFPWPLEGGGQMIFSTASLMEQDAPYLLPLELARGTVSQLADQLFEWKSIGLVVPDALSELASESIRQMAAAAMAQDNPAASTILAERVLRTAARAANQLAAAYVEQALAVRRRNEGNLASFLGADLGTSKLDNYTARHFLQAFNAANVPVRWRDVEAVEGHYDWSIPDRQIEWCRENGLLVSAGPLLPFDARALPDWLALWEGDMDNLLVFFTDHIRTVVDRYRGKVDMWQCAGQVNTGQIFSLSEEDKLQLTASAIDMVRTRDPRTPVVVSFDQPWAEYTAQNEVDFPPLHFADALIRSDLGLSGVMLEINVGYYPGGTMPRNPLEFSRQLDAWSIWGLPLWLSISVPSLCDADPMANRNVTLPPGAWTPAAQQAWVARYVPLMLSKNFVQGVIWNQLHDSRPHNFPYGGLFDLRRRAKPAMRRLAALRKALLK
jgi:hypothetical protein